MRGWHLKPLPAALLVVTVAFELAAVGLSWDLESRYDTLLYAFYSVVQVAAGALVASRHPRNPIGWLFCGFGALNALSADLAQGWGLRAAQEGWPGGPAAEWVSEANWLPGGVGLILTFLLFPDGHFLSPRWRHVLWIGLVGFVLALPGWSLSPDRATEFAAGRNPLATTAIPTEVLLAVGLTLFLGALVASAASLVIRFRRSRGVERRQLMWFTYAAAVAAVVLPLASTLWLVTPVVHVLAALALTALPVAASIGILRYRLYDIDVVVNRTLVYGALSLLLGGAFAATTLLLGIALGSGSAWATAGATLVVAVAFRPLRVHVQDLVDRRFNRARYDARHRMAEFLERLRAGAAAPEDVQDVLRTVLSDPGLDLLFYLPQSELYVDARGVPVEGAPPEGREAVPVERGGQPLAMVILDPRGHEHPALLRDVVSGGGLAIEIARLRVELRRQLSEVEDSRARIVAAANDERRRIERDLHDGAQQRLVSIGLALRHAQHELSTASPADARGTLDDAVAEVAVAIEELRELSRGLPPSQLDAGLAPALRELAARAPVPVHVTAPNERFDRGVEAAAYFIACEGLTNAVKHAHATRIALGAGREDGRLVIRVTDDGVGGATPSHGSGLRGLTDRVAAHGGSLRIESDHGAGTALIAELPCGS